jgi:hypothetical protein
MPATRIEVGALADMFGDGNVTNHEHNDQTAIPRVWNPDS